MAVVCKGVNLLALVSLFLLAIGGFDDEKTDERVCRSFETRSFFGEGQRREEDV